MKKILFIALIFVQFETNAQKIGFVDMEDLSSRLPEMRSELTQLNKLKITWEKEIDLKKEKYLLMKTTFEDAKSMMTQDLVLSKQREVDAARRDWEQSKEQYFGENGEYNRKYSVSLHDYNDKIKHKIEALGAQNSYDAIFDKRSGQLLYSSSTNDITNQIFESMQSGGNK